MDKKYGITLIMFYIELLKNVKLPNLQKYKNALFKILSNFLL